MKKVFMPYYLSRAILSAGFAILVMGITGKALFMAVVLFSLFLLYLHSGWFSIDLHYPFMPLRRDSRGLLIQRKALIISVGVGLLIYLFSAQVGTFFGLQIIGGNIILVIAIITYFISQFVFFMRA
jgi:hypothetical protein